MKKVKLFVPILAMVAAMLAIVGAGSASASTVLCETETNPCANPVAAGSVVEATATNSTLATTAWNVNCTTSTMAIKVSKSSGELQEGQLTSLTLNGCKTGGGTSCTNASINLPAQAQFEAWGEFNGGLRLFGAAGKGNPGWHQICGPYINCQLTAAMELNVGGGAPANIFGEQALDHSGGFCFPEDTLTANWVVKKPNGGTLFVSEG